MRALLAQLPLILLCISVLCVGQGVSSDRISHARAYVFSARCKLHGLGVINFIANEEHESVSRNPSEQLCDLNLMVYHALS